MLDDDMRQVENFMALKYQNSSTITDGLKIDRKSLKAKS